MAPTIQLHKVAFVGSYCPRHCGIATFTFDLSQAMATRYRGLERIVVPVTDPGQGYDYGSEVRFEIHEQDRDSYRRAADFLNLSQAEVVSVQHEFGIFGGTAGSHVLTLLRELEVPVISTLHTVLDEPSPEQYRVLSELAALSARVAVMSERGKQFLVSGYGIPEEKVDIIPHGVPDMPFVDPHFYKDQYGVEGKLVLLTFGLLSPNKGIEIVLRALPALVDEFPELVYVVLGATHPVLLREQGEAYRLSLIRLAQELGVRKHVVFYDQFVELDRLLQFIGAADIFVAPYLNPKQITSGALAYAFGCGKPVIATRFWHAEELLADGLGVLVPFADPAAIAREIRVLLRDTTGRHRMRKRAYLAGREMVWGNTAQRYVESCIAARCSRGDSPRRQVVIKTLDQRDRQVPEVRLDHLFRMTDSTGLIQHATFVVPRLEEGYCTDDNARALLLTVLLEEFGQDSARVQQLATTYAAFVDFAFDPDRRRFRNFMGFNRCWLDRDGPDDAHGRALWALGACVGRSRRRGLQHWAVRLFGDAVASALETEHPREWAFALLGIHEYFRRLHGDSAVERLRVDLTARLLVLYDQAAGTDWRWFSNRLTYDNATLPHALILSGRFGNDPRALEVGLDALAWLVQVQKSESGRFRPVGSNGFFVRGEIRADFDQQPLEAHSTVSACIEAYGATGDVRWLDEARCAFDWFLGGNDLEVEVYDPTTGGCRDGLAVDRANENQGAESMLAYLLSLVELGLVEASLATFQAQSGPGRVGGKSLARAGATPC